MNRMNREFVDDDNRWIVSCHQFLEHTSPGAAEYERQRLSEKFPAKTFRLYRVKRVLAVPADQLSSEAHS